ncbi:hypothetical protein [Brevundimonas subvibrioides]|uniref:hypothetical protein n=1 Tax=Brevundimonas subvibrioides TaxID=74313 RepID=UPI0012EA157F|nr:hypothetical protein [Brevundimonas subvibrioides]
MSMLSLGSDFGSDTPRAVSPPDPAIWLSLDPWPVTRAGAWARAARPDGAAPIANPSVSSPTARLPTLADTAEGRAVVAAAPTSPSAAGALDLRDRIARSLRARLDCSPTRDGLSGVEGEACASRMIRDATPIHGSGDARRDRRLERQGARQLEADVARRQRPGGAVRPACEDAGPVSDCGVDVSIEIFSSIDGFFPGLRRDEDD